MKLTLAPHKKSHEVNSSLNDDAQIHEGSSYQANIPSLNSVASSNDHEATLLWRPIDSISEQELTNYIDFAYRTHCINEEQALAILQICKYNISKGKSLMEDYTPETDQWTDEDRFLFEQAYQYYGKAFSRIRHMLPEKTTAELVRYYYLWKKTRLYQSIMDKYEKQYHLTSHGDSDDEKDAIPVKALNNRLKLSVDESSTEENQCSNCEAVCKVMYSTQRGILCKECYVYWQKSNLMRPESSQSKTKRKKRKRPPKNLVIDLNDFIIKDDRDPIDKLENDIRNELVLIQSHNQSIERLTHESRRDLENMHIPFLIKSSNLNETTSMWTIEEILLAIQAFSKYGNDFLTIARIIGSTKSVHDIEKFYVDFRDRYQLDTLIELSRKSQTQQEDIFFC